MMSGELSWVTIKEAVNLAKNSKDINLTEADLYRQALYGNIKLSIYFQSPVILRKVQIRNSKIILKQTNHSIIERLCNLERNCFLNKRNLFVSTGGNYIYPTQRIIDTTFRGHESFLIQLALANTLGLPLPSRSCNDINYGVTTSIEGSIFQVFEKVSWQERVKQQTTYLSEDITDSMAQQILSLGDNKGYFPIHHLPQDACFVIRHTELEKLLNMLVKGEPHPPSSTRISRPLARLFWLACKNNETISPLIKQPYKLLSIFEKWALDEGITDGLSGDTLKAALKRGNPNSI